MFDRPDDARDREGSRDGRARVYDVRDGDDLDPRDGLARDLDLPRARSASWWSPATGCTN